MNETVEQAVDNFRAGLYCVQAILSAFREKYDLDAERRAASGRFGALTDGYIMNSLL